VQEKVSTVTLRSRARYRSSKPSTDAHQVRHADLRGHELLVAFFDKEQALVGAGHGTAIASHLRSKAGYTFATRARRRGPVDVFVQRPSRHLVSTDRLCYFLWLSSRPCNSGASDCHAERRTKHAAHSLAITQWCPGEGHLQRL